MLFYMKRNLESFKKIYYMTSINFNPKEVTEKILSDLADRSRDVIEKRYGLSGDRKMTLEAIGQKYGITRERVRQIENIAKKAVKDSDLFSKHARQALEQLEDALETLGGVAEHSYFLDKISKRDEHKNHIYLLLDLGDPFFYQKEDDHFNRTWFLHELAHEEVKKGLGSVYKDLDTNAIVTEQDIIKMFLDKIESKNVKGHLSDENMRRWLKLTKKIGSNPLGGYGSADSTNISTKGVRDYAYLTLREIGEPLHFTDVAKEVSERFGKKINRATAHNELIKDPRFVLVGRGLYGLSEWGFEPGTVSEVIARLLKKKALTEEDVMTEVLKRKHVKEATVLINLKNKSKFTKRKDGKYINK